MKPGTELAGGRYWIESELGRGGMAVVYRALDQRHDRIVAIKVIDAEVTSRVTADRFMSEIQVAAGLTHPHILPVHDSGVADNRLYYVMPFVPGRTLRERIAENGPLPVAEALRIVRQVASALDYAHREGVLHRDVKPENILLADGHAVLTDFGLACALSAGDEPRLTATGMVVGTPRYMSPEQATGETEVDGRSDQYSLACVLYEMLAGEPPYAGTTIRSVLGGHLLQPVPRVTAVRPDVPPAVDEAITRALSKSPGERFASNMDFSAALEGAVEPESARAATASGGKGSAGSARSLLPLMVAELQRRGVLRAASLYVVGAWVAMQGADMVVSAFELSRRWVALAIVVAIIGLPVVVILAWLYRWGVGVEPESAPPGLRSAGRPLQTAVAVAILGGVALLTLGGWMTLRHSRTDAPAPSLDRLAVLFFTDDTHDAQHAALGPALTTELIKHLSRVEGMSVISRAGVEQFRNTGLPTDSIGRALGVDLLVSGTVLQSGGLVRVLVDVIDARSGTTIDQVEVTQPATDPIALVDAVMADVTDWLLGYLGREQRLRRWRAGTDNAEAWLLLQQSIEREERSRELLDRGDPAAAAAELATADSLLAEAERLDPDYHDASVQRAWIAERNAFLAILAGRDSVAERWALAGESHAGRVLQKQRQHAGAYEARGVLREFRYTFTPPRDATHTAALLQSAERDLQQATRLDPRRPRALHALSTILAERGAFAEALVLLEEAYRADSYRQEATRIADRLFTINFELANDSAAEKWCGVLRRRTGAATPAAACELQLLAWAPHRSADIDSAWATAEAAIRESQDPPGSPNRALLQVLVADVIARAGRADSAVAVLDRAYSRPAPFADLLQLEAGVRARLGDYPRAVDLLSSFLAELRVRGRLGAPALLVSSRRFRNLPHNPLAQTVAAAE